MLKIGKKIAAEGANQAAAGALVEDWQTHFPDMVSDERVGQLLDQEGLPSLDDFLEIYDSPVDIIMEGDTIWPPERATVY